MNINAISSFNNATKAQSFKAEPNKRYYDPSEPIPDNIPDSAIVDYSNFGDCSIPITAGERRAAQAALERTTEDPKCNCCGDKETTYASWGPNYIYPVSSEIKNNIGNIAAQNAYAHDDPPTERPPKQEFSPPIDPVTVLDTDFDPDRAKNDRHDLPEVPLDTDFVPPPIDPVTVLDTDFDPDSEKNDLHELPQAPTGEFLKDI